MSRFRPTDEKQLAEIVSAALDSEEPLEIVAGGSKRGLGRPLQAPHTLDVSGFSGIRQYEPEELVLSAGAATPLDEIEKTLKAKRQIWPSSRAIGARSWARAVKARPWAESYPATWPARAASARARRATISWDFRR